MKLTVTSSDLLIGINRVIGLIDRKSSIQILNNVLLRTMGSAGLQISANNLDMAMVTTIPGKVEENGEATVSGHLLQNAAKQFFNRSATADVKLVLDGANLKVSSGRSRLTLQTLPSDQFPNLSLEDVAHEFELTGEEVIDLFGRTQFSIGHDVSRYWLNGVFLHHGNDKIFGASTTGYMVSQIKHKLPESASGFKDHNNETGVIVPEKAVAEIIKLAKGAGKVKMEVAPTKIGVSLNGGETAFLCKLLDGTYPNYEKVFPKKYDVLRLSREDFAKAIDLVTLVHDHDPKKNSGSVQMAIDGNTALLSHSGNGEAEEELSVNWDGDPITIHFNGRYVINILDEINSADVEVHIAGPAAPATFMGPGDNARFCLMLMAK